MRRLTTVESGVWQPRVSPDGTRLAFVEGGSGSAGAVGSASSTIATGEDRIAGRGDVVDWLDDDTLIVATYGD